MRWPWSIKQAPPAGANGNGASPGAPVDSTIAGSVPLDRTSNAMLKEYTRSIYLWRCVDMIAQMSSSIVLEVKPGTTRQLTEDEQTIQDLLARPNPQWNAAALQYYVTASLAVANKSYLKRVRSAIGSNRPTLELWPIPANEVTAKYENGILVAYERTTATKKDVFPVDEEGEIGR